MQQPTTSTSQNNGGGLFGRGTAIFGGSKPATTTRTTSNGSIAGSNDSSTYSAAISKGAGFVRKASFSANAKNSGRGDRGRNNSIAADDPNLTPRKRSTSIKGRVSNLAPPVPSTLTPPSPRESEGGPKSADSARTVPPTGDAVITQEPGAQSITSTTAYNNMLSSLSSSSQAAPYGQPPIQPPSPTLETITYQHIQEMASKRMQTLYYLRKVHEGRVYWFNTVLFNKNDLQRMPYFEPRKLARRATNYLLLGLSLPVILDINSASPLELLKALNALFAEFESFQQAHPPDGSASSLTRGRFPQMFKRSNVTGVGRRRTSSAADIGLPMSSENGDSKFGNGSISAGGASTTAVPLGEADLFPGEEYTHLLTPSLPFDPDFYETFATLCDVLIDCYTKLMSLIPSPRDCTPVVAELFTKVDARVRKVIVQGVVKEFEESSRVGVKSEIAGVGKVVLGALM
ncbi:hypothetical protein B7463_g7657, partial [Scytalidium lignicola]